jgi:hypothetical protein
VIAIPNRNDASMASRKGPHNQEHRGDSTATLLLATGIPIYLDTLLFYSDDTTWPLIPEQALTFTDCRGLYTSGCLAPQCWQNVA